MQAKDKPQPPKMSKKAQKAAKQEQKAKMYQDKPEKKEFDTLVGITTRKK